MVDPTRPSERSIASQSAKVFPQWGHLCRVLHMVQWSSAGSPLSSVVPYISLMRSPTLLSISEKASSRSEVAHGCVWFHARCAAAGDRSLRIAWRPARAAATPVMPDPQNGSRTTSPGFVKCSMNGVIASGGTFVW
ncbi:hypothetical protein D3C80_1587970 [compost metagenome]